MWQTHVNVTQRRKITQDAINRLHDKEDKAKLQGIGAVAVSQRADMNCSRDHPNHSIKRRQLLLTKQS